MLLFSPLVSLAEYKPQESYSGEDLQLIKAAMPELTKQGYKADEIKIDISRDENKYVVSAVNKKADILPGQIGSPAGFPIYSVYLDKKNLKVLRSQFNK